MIIKNNLIQVAALMPALFLALVSADIIISALTEGYLFVRNVSVNIDGIWSCLITIITLLVMHAVYFASQNKLYNIKFKVIYPCSFLFFICIALMLGTVYLFDKTHFCDGDYACSDVPLGATGGVVEGASDANTSIKKAVSVKPYFPAEQDSQDDTLMGYHELMENVPEASSEDLKAVSNIKDDMLKTASEKDWDSFVLQADELSKYYIGLLVEALLTAFQFDAPMEVVDKLVEMGAPLVNDFRMIPIMFEGDIERLNHLVERGVSLVEPDFSGNTALHTATSSAFGTSPQHTHAVVKLLLQHGVDVNALGGNSDTALSNLLDVASTEYYVDTIKLLVDHGATVSEADLAKLEALKFRNPDYYQILRDEVPVLFADN